MLIYEQGDVPVRVIPIERELVVGRLGYGAGKAQPVQVMDDRMSAGRQAFVRPQPTGLVVAHAGSGAETRVNGVRVEREQVIEVGAVVQLGRTMCLFEHTLVGTGLDHVPRALKDAIFARPSDDAPRRVLADWLSEHGDPRGEFISCQLEDTTEARRRAEKLLALHELEWVDPLPAPVVSWSFARGFLDEVAVRDVAAAEALRAHHPLRKISALARPPSAPLPGDPP